MCRAPFFILDTNSSYSLTKQNSIFLLSSKALIRKEIDIMNHLHHCKLINLHDAFEDEDEMVLIFEL